MSRDSLLEAIHRLKPARMLKSYLSKLFEISYSNGEVIFSVEGSQVRQPAKGQWTGIASCKYNYALSLTKFNPTTDPVRIEFVDGKIKIETMRIPATWIIPKGS